MAVHMNTLDRVLRIVGGGALLGWALLGHGPAWAWLGILPLATGLIQWCPLYLWFKRR